MPSFRISLDFPSFRLLGFGGIFRRSVIPRFHLLGFGGIFHRSVIPLLSFRFWGNFPLFHDSAIPSFRLLGSPTEYNTNLTEVDLQRKTEYYYVRKPIDQVLIALQ